MYKLVSLYRQVDDESVLETFFSETHLPYAEQLPGLVGSEVCRILGKPGGKSRFHLSYALYFLNQNDMYKALQSNAGISLFHVLKEWVDAGVITWFHGEVQADGHTPQRHFETVEPV